MDKKAVILLSGGLDSTTTLAMAREQEFSCYALSFAYEQRHQAELVAARQIAEKLGAIEHRVVSLTDLKDLLLCSNAMTDLSIKVPNFEKNRQEIPITYVPARNTIFLSIALSWAEALDAQAIFIGANAIDYSGYPDCRPVYFEAFTHLSKLATKRGIEQDRPFAIHTPLLYWSKSQIIQEGIRLGVDYALTVSCYQADELGEACGHCDSCHFRRQGFSDAGIADLTRYQTRR